MLYNGRLSIGGADSLGEVDISLVEELRNSGVVVNFEEIDGCVLIGPGGVDGDELGQTGLEVGPLLLGQVELSADPFETGLASVGVNSSKVLKTASGLFES